MHHDGKRILRGHLPNPKAVRARVLLRARVQKATRTRETFSVRARGQDVATAFLMAAEKAGVRPPFSPRWFLRIVPEGGRNARVLVYRLIPDTNQLVQSSTEYEITVEQGTVSPETLYPCYHW